MFSLQIDDIIVAQFNKVTSPDITSDTVEYSADDELSTIKKIPGLVKYGNVILKQGITDSIKFHTWCKGTIAGNSMKEARKNIQIILIDKKGEKASEWNFSKCFACPKSTSRSASYASGLYNFRPSAFAFVLIPATS